MKKKKVLLCLGMSLLMGLSCALCACGPNEPVDPSTNNPPPVENPPVENPPVENPPVENPPVVEPPKYEPLTSITYRDDFTPTRFDGESAKYEITQLGTGVCVVKNTVTRADGKVSTVYVLDVDLNFANIVAGTKNNETTKLWSSMTEDTNGTNMLATPYSMAKSWEQANKGGHVYASLNADFFGSSGCNGWMERSVNAFVKDGVLLKAGHNDTGNYDYKNATSDVPASAPMLFGIKGNTAQIAPIIQFEGNPEDATVKEQLITAKLTSVTTITANGTALTNVKFNEVPGDDGVSYITESGSYNYERNTLVLKLVANAPDASGSYDLEVVSKELTSGKGTVEVANGETCILVRKMNTTMYSALNKLEKGSMVDYNNTIKSPDGTWDGYTTILGTRQALVIDGEVPATVTKENTNGAQSQNVPRSAVGIMPNGHVVVFAIEDLHYYKTSKSEDDTYGMNLPTLAEFMKFYGVKMGANFDGGGSTQLVMRGEDEDEAKVYVRAADTAFKDNNTNVLKSRVVMNSILITNKLDD